MKIEGFEKPKRPGRRGSDVYGLRTMEVKENRFIAGKPATTLASRVSNAAAYVHKATGKKFTTSTVTGGETYGLWVAPEDGVVVTRTA